MNNNMNPNTKTRKTMRKAFYLTVAAALIVLAACSDKEPDNSANDGRTAVRVTNAGIVGNTQNSPNQFNSPALKGTPSTNRGRVAATRATDAAWQAGDAIGLILFEATTSIPVEGKTAYIYKTLDEMGNFSASDAENTAYYPTQGKEADVLAFYPYRETGTDLMVPVSTADQTALSRLDLMVSAKSTGHSALKPDVSLTFSHKLVKLVITVDRDPSAAEADLQGATLKLAGTPTKAQWSLAEEQLTTDTGSKADISIPMTYDSAVTSDAGSDSGTADTPDLLPGRLSATAIVLPTAADSGVKLVVTTTAGKTFDAPLPATAALAAGTVNTLRVHLRQTEAVITATVADWTTGVTADLPSLKMDVNAASGTAEGISNLQLWNTAASAVKADYSFDATTTAWSSTTPFYLENLTDGTDAFFARHTPTSTGTTYAVDPVSGLPDVLGNTTPAVLTQGGISLTLQHLYSRLSLTLLRGEDFGRTAILAGATVKLDGFKKAATLSDENVAQAIDAPTPAAATGADPATGTTYTLTTDEAGATTFIAVPQTLAATATLSVTLANGNTYTTSL